MLESTILRDLQGSVDDIAFVDKRASAAIRRGGMSKAAALDQIRGFVKRADFGEHYVGEGFQPAWEKNVYEFSLTDDEGRTWTLKLFHDLGTLYVHRVKVER